MSSKIFITAPANAVSGGPELCHQLADVLNQKATRAFILYYPWSHAGCQVPWRYQKYRVETAAVADVEPDSIVVVPESATNLLTSLPQSRVYFWWMSVNRFAQAAAYGADFGELRGSADRHLYQSDFARCFLEAEGLLPASRLSDRLADEYLEAIAYPPTRVRRDLVVYNPVKGMRRTQRVLDELRSRSREPVSREPVTMVPVTAMFRPNQVRDLLSLAKVYIDFGDHPGKDRLPREAAACGACVLTNRRGSAANPVDVPIPDAFKIDDETPGFEEHVVDAIQAVLGDFEHQQPRFGGYRKAIVQESTDFIDDIAEIFPE